MGDRRADTEELILTEQQQAVVDTDGNFLLLACPGSGKTRSAAERTARLVRKPSTKVAVCSYTNVGAERIGSVLASDLGIVLDHEHFLGTIHRFLLQFVVHPYAHLIGAKRGPVIHEGDWPEVRVHDDNAQRISLDKFRYAADGTLVAPHNPRGVKGTAQEILASVGEEVKRRKGGFFREAGVVSADDAMWVALSILRKRTDVASAVAGRFDELLLDEAQDTSELQLACLELLHRTGRLPSLVLVGDIEQSIYSFMGADVERLRGLAAGCELTTLSLTENHRSSQLICDVARHFCNRAAADTAVGPHRDCGIAPEVMLYPAKDPNAAMDSYRSRLTAHGIDVTAATVLARNWRVVDALNGQTPLFDADDRQDILVHIAAGLAAGTLTRKNVNAAQRMLAYCAWDTTRFDDLTDDQRRELRAATAVLIGNLPVLAGTVGSWLTAAREELHKVASVLADGPPSHTGGRAVVVKRVWADQEATEVFAPVAPDLTARTVHGFKGEDSEAVMIVVRRMIASDPTAQMELWEAAVAGADVDADKAEERRVIFVALTRAQRYCLIALPDDKRGKDVAGKCETLGFRVLTS